MFPDDICCVGLEGGGGEAGIFVELSHWLEYTQLRQWGGVEAFISGIKTKML
jgi:hypothetical protein